MTPYSLVGGNNNVSEETVASIFRLEDVGYMFLRSVGNHLQYYMAS
jgi:hypothetical protein